MKAVVIRKEKEAALEIANLLQGTLGPTQDKCIQ